MLINCQIYLCLYVRILMFKICTNIFYWPLCCIKLWLQFTNLTCKMWSTQIMIHWESPINKTSHTHSSISSLATFRTFWRAELFGSEWWQIFNISKKKGCYYINICFISEQAYEKQTKFRVVIMNPYSKFQSFDKHSIFYIRDRIRGGDRKWGEFF